MNHPVYAAPEGFDLAALEAHLDDKARARRRRDQEVRRSNAAVPWSGKGKARDNRAAAKRAVAKEVWA